MNKQVNSIKINHGDILWRLYCLYFTLKGVELESPKNLCNYFQTAVKGLLLWPITRLNLLLAWMGLVCGYGLVALCFAIRWGLDDTATGSGSHLLYLVEVVLPFPLLLLSMLVMTVSFFRFDNYLKKSPRVQSILCIVFVSIMVISLFYSDHHSVGEHTKVFFWFILKFVGGSIAVFALIFLLFKLALKIVPDTRWKRMRVLCCVIGIRFDAWKREICPLVEAPKEETSQVEE